MTKARIGDDESKDWQCRKQGLAMTKARIGDDENKEVPETNYGSVQRIVSIVRPK